MAAAELSGHRFAADIQAGQYADDLLFIPCFSAYEESWVARACCMPGDGKSAALATRAEIVTCHDFYLI